MAEEPLLVVGVGYLGERVLQRLTNPVHCGIGRSSGLDLDAAQPQAPALPDAYQVLYTVPPSPEFDQDVRLQRLLELLDPLPARLIYISTTGVYGDHDGARVVEDSALRAGTARARRRLAAERALTEWSHDHDVDLLILRTPGIYGPERLGIARIEAGQAVICEAEAYPGNRIHVDDLVSCCIAARSAAPGIYNLGDGDHRSSGWFSREVARQAGLPRPPEVGRADAQRRDQESRIVDTGKMRRQLGVALQYPDAADGIRAALAASDTPAAT